MSILLISFYSQEYLLANGEMSALPVAFSLMASFMSAVTLLGVTAENYMYGTQYMMINFAYVVGTPIVTHVYLPVFYNLRLTSVYEVGNKRKQEPTTHKYTYTYLCYSMFEDPGGMKLT
jgi:sodium-coupled monocarboxylate transporter 8/12